MSPFYPYLLAGAYLLFGINSTAIAAVQIVQSVVGAATIYPLFYLAKEYYSRNTAFLSVFIFTIHPDFLHWSYLIQQLTFTTFFVVCLVYMFDRFRKVPTVRNATAAGIVAGIGLLVDAIIIAIIGLFVLWLLVGLLKQWFRDDRSFSSDLRTKLVTLFIALLICMSIITPWTIRCLNVYDGQFVFMKASGFNLWRGNNPNYTATGIPPWVNTEILTDLNLPNEGDIDSALGQIAVAYMLSHPVETLVNVVRKLVDFWWFPQAFPEESPLERQLIYAPLLLLAIIAVIVDRTRVREIVPLLLPILAFSILYSVVFVLAHHRIPIQPFLFILSARGIECVWHRKENDSIFDESQSPKKRGIH